MRVHALLCPLDYLRTPPTIRGKSRKTVVRISTAMPSLFFLFLFCVFEGDPHHLRGLVRHFALELDLLKPAMSMFRTNCSQNWWITLAQQEVRSCPFCIQLLFPSLVKRGF